MKWNKKFLGSFIIFIIFSICLVTGWFISRPAKTMDEKELFTESTEFSTQDTKKIIVYINGEVKKPGVYTLENGSRIKDVIEASGGFTENADTKNVNLAKKVRDEDYILIDKAGGQESGNGKSASNGINDGIVNINTATKEELMTVPGIGEVTAAKIIEYREANGDFSKIEDLTKVDRIGEKTLAKFKDKIEAR